MSCAPLLFEVHCSIRIVRAPAQEKRTLFEVALVETTIYVCEGQKGNLAETAQAHIARAKFKLELVEEYQCDILITYSWNLKLLLDIAYIVQV